MERKTGVKRMALLMAFVLACMTVFVTPNTAEAAAPKTKKITLSAKKQTLYVGKNFTLKVKKVTPKKASKKVTYKTSNKKVATVSKSGKVTGKKAGKAKITVISKANKKAKAVCQVTVKQQIKSITVTNAPQGKITLDKGKTITLATTISPKNASSKGLTFSSDKANVASVDSKGTITAKAAGTAVITVAAADKQGAKASVTVTVKDSAPTSPATVAVTGVTLNKTTLTLAKGASETLTANVAPANATNKAVTWKSSDIAIATVDNAGKVTAVAAGTATVTVTTVDGNKTATCTVTVSEGSTSQDPEGPVAVTGVTLNKSTLGLGEGQTGTLTATVAPSNATNQAVTWSSSNEAVATVNPYGVVTAVAKGTAIITVTTTDGNKTATCEVTVAEGNESGIVIPNITMAVGETKRVEPSYIGGSAMGFQTVEDYRIVATGDQAYQPETTSDVISIEWHPGQWGSAAPDNGDDISVTITALKEGTAYVQVQLNVDNDGGPANNPIYATMKVTVGAGGGESENPDNPDDPETVAVTGITLNQTTLSLKLNQKVRLRATVAPENATNKNVTWSSSDTAVAKVDSYGQVTAKAEGTATITATTEDGNKTATCTVTVTAGTTPEDPEDPGDEATIKLNRNPLVLWIDGEETLTVHDISDEWCETPLEDVDVTWTTSNPEIVTVDDGKVKAVAKGTATVTATANGGNRDGQKASCDVTVLDPATDADDVVTFPDIELTVGETKTVTPVYTGNSPLGIQTVVYSIDEGDTEDWGDTGEKVNNDDGQTITGTAIELTWARQDWGAATDLEVTIEGLAVGEAYVRVELNVDDDNGPSRKPIYAIMKVTVTAAE